MENIVENGCLSSGLDAGLGASMEAWHQLLKEPSRLDPEISIQMKPVEGP